MLLVAHHHVSLFIDDAGSVLLSQTCLSVNPACLLSSNLFFVPYRYETPPSSRTTARNTSHLLCVPPYSSTTNQYSLDQPWLLWRTTLHWNLFPHHSHTNQALPPWLQSLTCVGSGPHRDHRTPAIKYQRGRDQERS